MSAQLNKILLTLIILCAVFMPHSGYARSVGGEWKEVQTSIQNFISSFSIKDNVDAMNPKMVIFALVVMILLALLFRSFILFIIVFAILIIIFYKTDKTKSYLEEKFSFIKNIDLNFKSKESDTQDKDKS